MCGKEALELLSCESRRRVRYLSGPPRGAEGVPLMWTTILELESLSPKASYTRKLSSPLLIATYEMGLALSPIASCCRCRSEPSQTSSMILFCLPPVRVMSEDAAWILRSSEAITVELESSTTRGVEKTAR